MKNVRKLLLPIAWLYGFVTFIRNQCYDWGIFPSRPIKKKSILIGNLSVGGTGKSPLVEYVVEHFLARSIKLVTLSRGYGRTTKGLIHAKQESTASEIGDEPRQFKSKFTSNIEVIVAEKRTVGVDYIEQSLPETELILLDDAFQHRAVKAGLQILVTPYNDLFCNDLVLPAGNLREWKRGKYRADLIVVSKCPQNLSENDKLRVKKALGFPTNSIFFSSIEYLPPIGKIQFGTPENILIVTGIGNPQPLLEEWQDKANVEHMAFGDHHNFSSTDITRIHEKFDIFANQNKVILTTEKDYMRIERFPEVQEDIYPWYYQPIALKMHDQQLFKAQLDGYFDQI